MRIDALEDWRDDWTFGAEATLSLYSPPPQGTSFDPEATLARMKTRFDEYISQLDFENGEYTFFFPPYSALYWNYAREAGNAETYLAFKAYAEGKLLECKNVRIFDFQNADFVTDLDNYKDYTHYAPEINDRMLGCFSSGEYLVTAPAEAEALIVKTDAQVTELLERYPQVPH